MRVTLYLQVASDDGPPAMPVDQLGYQLDPLCIPKHLNVRSTRVLWPSRENQRPQNVLVGPDPFHGRVVKLFFVDEYASLGALKRKASKATAPPIS